ncbi:hypothetical protein B0H13DRAFT_1881014 [Mycena leptocephala]|nr:hypothetical protein B0H13DRAFT_1881014 [Mycena leptocephala]
MDDVGGGEVVWGMLETEHQRNPGRGWSGLKSNIKKSKTTSAQFNTKYNTDYYSIMRVCRRENAHLEQSIQSAQILGFNHPSSFKALFLSQFSLPSPLLSGCIVISLREDQVHIAPLALLIIHLQLVGFNTQSRDKTSTLCVLLQLDCSNHIAKPSRKEKQRHAPLAQGLSSSSSSPPSPFPRARAGAGIDSGGGDILVDSDLGRRHTGLGAVEGTGRCGGGAAAEDVFVGGGPSKARRKKK